MTLNPGDTLVTTPVYSWYPETRKGCACLRGGPSAPARHPTQPKPTCEDKCEDVRRDQVDHVIVAAWLPGYLLPGLSGPVSTNSDETECVRRVRSLTELSDPN